MPRHRIAREDLKPVLAAHYAGACDPAELKRSMLAGFARFAEVQAGFMDALAEA